MWVYILLAGNSEGFEWFIVKIPGSVGRRLLRLLGWIKKVLGVRYLCLGCKCSLTTKLANKGQLTPKTAENSCGRQLILLYSHRLSRVGDHTPFRPFACTYVRVGAKVRFCEAISCFGS